MRASQTSANHPPAIASCLLALFKLLSIPIIVLLLIWLVVSQSLRGRILGLAAIALALLPLLNQRARLVSGGLALLGIAYFFFSIPSGHTRPSSPVTHQFATDTTFNRFALTNIIPEIEQMNAGFYVVPLVDSRMDYAQARRVGPLTLDIYKEMERDPDFRRLGSAMPYAYRELYGAEYDLGHYYLYVPDNRPSERLPALVFLHGSGGNFKTYTWVLSQLAEERGMIIVAPSFGFGNWDQPGGTEAALRALDHAMTVAPIDPDRVILAGLSNGGLGVSGVGASASHRFQGLIFISPVFDEARLQSTRFRTGWRDRPVLVISGEADRRISISYVEQRANLLSRQGAKLTLIKYAGEDHFLMFTRRDDVLSSISDWLAQTN